MNRNEIARTLITLGLLAGIVAADTLTIPPDQPICRLYGMIQVFGTVGAVILAAYAGFLLATSHEIEERNKAKLHLASAIIGLIVIWLAPLIVKSLVGATDVCGW